MRTDFSSNEVGEMLGYPGWRIRRLFERKELPEPPRFAGRRLIPRSMIPAILDALRRGDRRHRKQQGGASNG